jgi:chemosensory pili system protein ChpA (sensor histidine kinase/response regulator)
MGEQNAIVVVDDSPSVRETIAFILESEGYEVHRAVNGREGIEIIRSIHPRVVLLDAMMPEMDGFDVCRRIRADAALTDIHVVMLTTMGMEADRERAVEAGVNHFLTKPFDADEVLQLLEGLFSDDL